MGKNNLKPFLFFVICNETYNACNSPKSSRHLFRKDVLCYTPQLQRPPTGGGDTQPHPTRPTQRKDAFAHRLAISLRQANFFNPHKGPIGTRFCLGPAPFKGPRQVFGSSVKLAYISTPSSKCHRLFVCLWICSNSSFCQGPLVHCLLSDL